VTGGDAFVTSDVGQHQMWAAQFYKFDKPRRWINSGGLGTMGFGLPAAMARSSRTRAPRWRASRRSELHDVHAGALDLQAVPPADQDREPQQPLHGHGSAVAAVLPRQPVLRVLHDALPDFVKLAESFGHIGVRVEKPATSSRRCREAFTQAGSRLPRFPDHQSENVYPMVPGGKGSPR